MSHWKMVTKIRPYFSRCARAGRKWMTQLYVIYNPQIESCSRLFNMRQFNIRLFPKFYIYNKLHLLCRISVPRTIFVVVIFVATQKMDIWIGIIAYPTSQRFRIPEMNVWKKISKPKLTTFWSKLLYSDLNLQTKGVFRILSNA